MRSLRGVGGHRLVELVHRSAGDGDWRADHAAGGHAAVRNPNRLDDGLAHGQQVAPLQLMPAREASEPSKAISAGPAGVSSSVGGTTRTGRSGVMEKARRHAAEQRGLHGALPARSDHDDGGVDRVGLRQQCRPGLGLALERVRLGVEAGLAR